MKCPIEPLLHRLQHTPIRFLDEPRLGTKGDLVVKALAGDVLRHVAGDVGYHWADVEQLDVQVASERNRMRITVLVIWLLFDVRFFGQPALLTAIQSLLLKGLHALASLVDAGVMVTDTDRREELVRYVLDQLHILPEGETRAQAQDRLQTLDSVEQQRVMEASRAAEARARQVREEIQRRLAEEEAAAKAMRE